MGEICVKKTITYLSGPIEGIPREEATTWRNYVTTSLGGAENVRDPTKRNIKWEKNDREIASRIVEPDLKDIDDSDILLVNFLNYNPSARVTSMEIEYAYAQKKYIIVVSKKETLLSPWVVHRANIIVNSLDNGIDLIYNKLKESLGKDMSTSTDKGRVLREKFITRDFVRAHPDWIFLFDDNKQFIGYEGQAYHMRGEPNAIGIITKITPKNSEDAYFSDGDGYYGDYNKFVTYTDHEFNELERLLMEKGKTIVIPTDGLGTGLAKLQEKAPRCFAYLQERIKQLENLANV